MALDFRFIDTNDDAVGALSLFQDIHESLFRELIRPEHAQFMRTCDYYVFVKFEKDSLEKLLFEVEAILQKISTDRRHASEILFLKRLTAWLRDAVREKWRLRVEPD